MRCPTSASSAIHGFPSSRRSARSSLCSLTSTRRSAVPHDDYFAGIWDTNVIDGSLYGVPWYIDTRLLFYRKDLLARAGFPEPPRDWSEWTRALAAVKANAGAGNYAIFLPLNEFEPLLNLAVQEPDPLLRDNDTRGNFESPGFRRAFDFYVDMFRRGWAPPMSNTEISNVWDEFARGFYTFYITGPWNVGEFSRRLPADTPERLGHCAAARTRRPRRGDRRRQQPRHILELAAQARGLAADRVPVRAGTAGSLPRVVRRSAAAPQRVERSRAGQRRFTRRRSAISSNASSRRRKFPSGSASRRRCASLRSARSAAAKRLTRCCASSTRAPIRSSRSAAGC